jgi:hypothetical protein
METKKKKKLSEPTKNTKGFEKEVIFKQRIKR